MDGRMLTMALTAQCYADVLQKPKPLNYLNDFENLEKKQWFLTHDAHPQQNTK